jgi:hypothetical protein
VITPADPWFGGRFGTDRLEELLNGLAREGWRVIGMAGSRTDPMVLMERVVDEAHVAEPVRRR